MTLYLVVLVVVGTVVVMLVRLVAVVPIKVSVVDVDEKHGVDAA
jgi:hypothetical protein